MEDIGVIENLFYWKSENAGLNLKNFAISLDPSIFMWKLN